MPDDTRVDLALFYADGSIVEASNDDAIEVTFTFKVARGYLEAPSHGVQAIVQRDPYACRNILHGQDHFYSLPGGLIHSTDSLAPFLEQYLPGIVKHGVCLSREEWTEQVRKLKEYQTIPAHGCARKPRPESDLE